MSHKLRTIPLCQLRPSKDNIRKTDRLAGIAAMAENIQENDLLENLVVQLARRGNGHDPLYDVVAGGRRYAALKLLAKRRKITRDYPVRCLLLDEEDSAVEVSLTENLMRMPVHPADQFEAFAALAKEGLSADDMAARFGVAPAFVQQRLKLACISPKLIAEYRSGAMTLEQLTAFTLSDSHAAQEEVWFERAYAEMPAQLIRRLLTTAQVPGSDPRARFIGAQAYVAAGGAIVRDLFDAEDEGYFSDSQRLDALVHAKLESTAEEVRGEGWSWVEVHSAANFVSLTQYDRAEETEVDLGEAEEARLQALSDQCDELSAGAEDGDDNAEAGLEEAAAELNVLLARKVTWGQPEKGRSGALICLGHDGEAEIVRGLIRRDPNSRAEPACRKAEEPNGSRRGESYSEAVMVELSAQRTAALRELVARNPAVAITAVLHALVSRILYSSASPSCLTIKASEVSLEQASDFVAQSKAGLAHTARHRQWRERLPEAENLWQFLKELEEVERLDLLAHCVSCTVNALHGRLGQNQEHATDLARDLALHMREWWEPTRDSFLNRITKEQILAAVSEAVSQQASWRLAKLKKERMAKEAEKLLAECAWLPVHLRVSERIQSSAE